MLNFAMIGLGQYGGRQVDAFLSLGNTYRGVAINTATNDLAGLQLVPERNRVALEGNSLGAGKTPQIAIEAMEDNAGRLYPIVRDVVTSTDFTFLIAGLGGGTGTGTLSWMLEEFDKFFGYADPNHIGLIVTLPRDSDGATEKSNAVLVLQQIDALIHAGKLGAVIILDNDRFYTQFAKEHRQGDWRELSNLELARLFHNINELTVDAGSANFDQQDFKSLLVTPGCLALGKKRFEKLNPHHLGSIIQNTVKTGFFSSDFIHEEAKAYAICFQLNEAGSAIRTAEFEKIVDDNMDQLFPHAYNKFNGFYSSAENRLFTVVAGLGLPDRVPKLIEQVKNVRVAQTRTIELPDDLPGFLSSGGALTRRRVAATVESNPYESPKEANPYGVNDDNPFANPEPKNRLAKNPFLTRK